MNLRQKNAKTWTHTKAPPTKLCTFAGAILHTIGVKRRAVQLSSSSLSSFILRLSSFFFSFLVIPIFIQLMDLCEFWDCRFRADEAAVVGRTLSLDHPVGEEWSGTSWTRCCSSIQSPRWFEEQPCWFGSPSRWENSGNLAKWLQDLKKMLNILKSCLLKRRRNDWRPLQL